MSVKSKRAAQSLLPKTWHEWISTNLRRGVPRQTLYTNMRTAGFGVGAIKEGMAANFPDAPLHDENQDPSNRTVDYAEIANCAVTKSKQAGLKKVLTSKAQVYVLDNFLSEEECRELIKLVNTSLHDSTITTQKTEKDYAFRTSKTCYLDKFDQPIVHDIDDRISKTLGISKQWAEPNQAQKYTAGQEFKAHTDYFEPGTPEYKEYCTQTGQRTWTFMVYLNEGCEGGGTRFRKLDKVFTPQTGKAVMWNNLSDQGDPNPYTLHHGTKVKSGEKYVITKWFRDIGKGPILID